MTIFLIGVILLMAAFIAAALLRGGVATIPPPVAAPTATPPAPLLSLPATAAETVRVRWKGTHGHVYGESSVVLEDRRPQIVHTIGGATRVFLASHQDRHGVWIYREVHK